MTSAENVLDTATHFSWFSDVGSAENLHHYKLSEKYQPYDGVGVSWGKKGQSLRSELCTRISMGFITSPLATTRIFVWGVEVILGDRKDEANPSY